MLKILLFLSLIHFMSGDSKFTISALKARIPDSLKAVVLYMEVQDTARPLKSQGIRTFRIKEIARARHQPKPEKITLNLANKDSIIHIRPSRIRRPSGLDRPPEIPRANGN